MRKKTTVRINKFGIQSKSEIDENISLERYRNVPLHSIFLYTTEDKNIHHYITKHWDALHAMSGNYCDIHQTFDQFELKEDAYDFIDKLNVINRSGFNSISKLPGIFFWNLDAEGAFVSFGDTQSEKDLTKIIRIIFEEIRKKPEISTVQKLNKSNKLKKNMKPTSLFNDTWPFLIIFIVVIASIALISTWVSPFILGIVLISTIIIFVLIGVFLFRYRDILSEKTFKELISLLIKQLPLLKTKNNTNKRINNKA